MASMRVQRPPLGNWRIRPGKRRSVKIAVPRLDPGQTIGKSPDRPEATWERYFAISVAPRLGLRSGSRTSRGLRVIRQLDGPGDIAGHAASGSTDAANRVDRGGRSIPSLHPIGSLQL